MPPARLGIQCIRFSKDYFPDKDASQKWMREREYNTDSVVEVERFINYLQLAKNRFTETIFQQVQLDSGVMADVGFLKEEQETNFDNIHDSGKIVFANEDSEQVLEDIKGKYLQHFDLFKAILETIISLTEPYKQVKDVVVNDLAAVVSDTTAEISKLKSKLSVVLSKRQEPTCSGEECEISMFVPIFKADDDEERTVFGEVLVPNEFDAEEDIYTADEIKKAAHYWMEHFGSIGLMHETLIDDQVVILESYLAPSTFTITKTDGTKRKVKKGTWLLKVRIDDDDLWEQAKNGELTGFSIGGVAQVQDLTDEEE